MVCRYDRAVAIKFQVVKLLHVGMQRTKQLGMLGCAHPEYFRTHKIASVTTLGPKWCFLMARCQTSTWMNVYLPAHCTIQHCLLASDLLTNLASHILHKWGLQDYVAWRMEICWDEDSEKIVSPCLPEAKLQSIKLDHLSLSTKQIYFKFWRVRDSLAW